MPMSAEFESRLEPVLKDIADHYGTPFHVYDETGIRQIASRLKSAFSGIPDFREFFAVKALPNPRILEIMKSEGFGADCSSITELVLSRQVGMTDEAIMFTSNNTSPEEFDVAYSAGGCIINLDDITLLDKIPAVPELLCFRYNPGPRRTGNSIIGNPVEAKYGVSHDQVIDAYRRAQAMGVTRFGLHTMLASNELNYTYMVETARMLLDLAEWIGRELDIRFEFLNIGGGLGIPYTPDASALDLEAMAGDIAALWDAFKERQGYKPALYMESGRFITGPHGALVVTAINRKDTYRKYIGVDACMSSLMRPGMYGAYHHITVYGKNGSPADQVVDVVGSLCENNDKFAIQRELPAISNGDILMIHDTGAHGQSMGFNYNGKLRPKELLLRTDGSVELIRRAETAEDYFATLSFTPDIMRPRGG